MMFRRRIACAVSGGPGMKNILLLEDLPEIRAWLKALVLQVFPDSQISESRARARRARAGHRR